MRHRRCEYNSGGKFYGGKVREDGSKHWNQNRLRENYVPRNRSYSFNRHDGRYDSERRYSECLSGFHHWDRDGETTSYSNRCPRISASADSYTNKIYETPVNSLYKRNSEANIEHPFENGNKQKTSEKLNYRILDKDTNIWTNNNKIPCNHSAQPNSDNSDTVKRNTEIIRCVKDFVPRNYTKTDAFPIQSRFNYGETLNPREQEAPHGVKERHFRTLSNYEPYGKTNINWKMNAVDKYWDLEGQNSGHLGKNKRNVNSVPKNDSCENFSYTFESNSLEQSTNELDRFQNANESIYLNGPDMTQPRTGDPYGIERTLYHWNMNSSGLGEKLPVCPPVQQGPAFVGHFTPFPQQNEHVGKEQQASFRRNSFEIFPSNYRPGPFQERTLLSEHMNPYVQPYFQPDVSFKDFSTDSQSHQSRYTSLYQPKENISHVITQSGTSQPIQLNIDTNIHVPQIQSNIVQDVSMIPLPPNPPPSLPNHPQQQGAEKDTSKHTPASPEKVNKINESESQSSGETSINVVSSTSVEQDEISPPVNDQNMMQESNTASTLPKEKKEKLADTEMSEVKGLQNVSTSNDNIECTNVDMEEQNNKGKKTDTVPVERLDHSRKHDYKFDSDHLNGFKNKVDNQFPVSKTTCNNNENEINTEDREAIVSSENERHLDSYSNKMQHDTKKDKYDQQYKERAPFSDKQNVRHYQHCQNNGWHSSNFKEPMKRNANIHRPRQFERKVDKHTPDYDKNESRHKYNSSYEPLRKVRPYDRTLHTRRRLSGVGIHTYPSYEHRQDEKHPYFSDYFRPWEKHINKDNTDLNKSIASSFFTTDPFPMCQNEFLGNPVERTGYECDKNTLTNIDLNTVRKETHCLMKDEENKQEKYRELNCEGKNGDTEKKEELKAGKESSFVRSQKKNNNTTIKGTKRPTPDDLFTKKRQDKYNHGHQYSEITAVNDGNDLNKKDENGRKFVKDNNTVSKKATKTSSGHDLNNNIFGRSKSFKHLTTPSTIAMPILSILESAISKVTSKGLSKVAKPDISLENKLLKSDFKISETKLGVYKMPCLSKSEEDSKVAKKVRFIAASSDEKVEEFRNTTLNNKSKHGSINKSKTKNRMKDEKCEKAEKSLHEILKKLKLKTGKDIKTDAQIKSLHPKLRHKLASLREDSKESDNRIAVRKVNMEQKYSNTDEVIPAENSAIDKEIEVNMKNKTSNVTRGKFVLCTPNTFKVKETKKTKQKEKTSESSVKESDISAKENLDKALFSAKKRLLHRALAVDAVTRDKTKPLVEKKSNQRKSLIPSDLSKQESNQLKGSHLTEIENLSVDNDEKSTVKDDNNNEINKLENPKEVSEDSTLKLDLPLTVYKPHRTMIGDYATQCLFGPVVSSTYYKAPGKSRVIRNSKETFTGYMNCQVDLRRYNDIDSNHDKHDDNGSSNKDNGCDVQISLTESESTYVASPLINTVPVSCGTLPFGFVNLSGKVDIKDTNNNRVKEKCSPPEVENLTGSEKECTGIVPVVDFEIPRKQITGNAYNGQTQVVETGASYFEQQQQPVACQTFTDSYMSHLSSSYCTPTQLELHNKYLIAKKEIEDSCRPCYNVSSHSASSVNTFIPTIQVSTLTSSSVTSGLYPVCSSTPIHVPDTGIFPPVTLDLEHKSAENSVANTSSNSESKYETSNEEFEMYRNYQLNRVGSYTDTDVQRSPYFDIDELCNGNEKEVKDKTHDSEQIRNENYCSFEEKENDNMCLSEGSFADLNTSMPVDENAIVKNPENYEPLIFEDDVSARSVFQCSDKKIDLQDETCGMINVDEDIQDTSKNMFEDLVTDILTDTDLLSSIPINAQDIISEKSIEFQDSSASHQLNISSQEDKTLSLKTPCKQIHCDTNFNKFDTKIDSNTTFKSARAPTRIGRNRKPRFEKRFPKPLPRAKPQKAIKAERMLYEAAERFLGDFDHKNKRSCCKVSTESSVNQVSGKVESAKTLKSIDCEVPKAASQRLAMKKLILKSKGQMFKQKAEVQAKGASKKAHSLVKSRNRNLQENRIPSIRLKTIKKMNGKGNVTVEKWKNVTSSTKEKIDKTEKKKQKCQIKWSDLLKKGKAVVKKEQKSVPELIVLDKNKSLAQKQQYDKHELDMKNKGKSVEHTKHSAITINFSNKKYSGKCPNNFTGISGNKGKGKIEIKSKKNNSSIVAKSANTSNIRSTKADSMDKKVKDIISRHSCKLCAFSCSKFGDMKLHYSREHVNWCGRCKKQFKNKESCQFHISQSHNADAWCDVCGTTFSSKCKLDRHLLSQYHQRNQKFVDLIEEKRKRKVAVSEDDDDDSVKIVGISKNVYRRKEMEGTGSVKHKKIKTSSDKSPTVNLDLKKPTSSEYVEISEDDMDTKKVPLVTYCKVCNQYYKKMSAHLKTRKHNEMLKEKWNNMNPGDGIFAITDSDMENISFNIDDDLQDDDDMEMRDNMSHSSDRSVVIVSDHDGNFEYESDECKAVQNEEDGSMYIKHGSGLQAKHAGQIKHESDKEQGSQNHHQKIDNVNLKCVDGRRESRNSTVPIVVNANRKEKCSPTLLVRNVAADLIDKDEPSDKRLNYFASVKQKHCNVPGSKDDKVLGQVEESNEEEIVDYMSAEDVYIDSDMVEDTDDIESFSYMSNISDYEITENPSFHDDFNMDQD